MITVIVAALLGAGFLTGSGLTADRRVSLATVFLAGVLAVTANFGVQSLLAGVVVRVNRRFNGSSPGVVRLRDLLAMLAIATLGATFLVRTMAWLGLGTFLGWSRYLPATSLVIAMLVSLTLQRSTRQAVHRVIVPLFTLQLLITAAFTLL